MFRSINCRTVIGVWLAVLVAVAGAGAVSGVSITLSTGALWLVACVVPPTVMLMVWRGAGDRGGDPSRGRSPGLTAPQSSETRIGGTGV